MAQKMFISHPTPHDTMPTISCLSPFLTSSGPPEMDTEQGYLWDVFIVATNLTWVTLFSAWKSKRRDLCEMSRESLMKVSTCLTRVGLLFDATRAELFGDKRKLLDIMKDSGRSLTHHVRCYSRRAILHSSALIECQHWHIHMLQDARQRSSFRRPTPADHCANLSRWINRLLR